MTVRAQDLVFYGGGECFEKYGVLIKRTSPGEEIIETHVCADARLYYDENGVLRQCAANVPRPDHVGDDTVLALEGALNQLCEFNVPGGTPSDYELSPMTVTNLTSEFYAEFDAGDDLTFVVLEIFEPNNFVTAVWAKPTWPSGDGDKHVIWEAKYDGTNYVQLYVDTDGDLKCNVVVGGADNITNLTLAISAADEIFVGAWLDDGSLVLYVDTDGDTTLDTDTDASVGALPTGSWTLYFGTDSAGANPFRGGLNVIILNNGDSADPITDRFDAGDGEDWSTWKAKYGSGLTLFLPDPDSGTFQALDSGLPGKVEELALVGANLELVD